MKQHVVINHNQTAQRGFTITELLVAVSIFTICIAMALGAFFGAYKMMYFTRMLDLSHTEVRNAIDRVSILARQSVYYPRIFSNGNLSVIGTYTNIAGGVTNIHREIVGNEVRMMYQGTIAELPNDLPANSSQITILNSATMSPASLFPAVYGQVNSNVSQAAFNASAGTIFRSENARYSPVIGDTIMIQTIGQPPTNIHSFLITNVTTNVSTTTLSLSSPTPIGYPRQSVLFIGPEARLIVSNNTLYFSENIAASQNFIILEKINTTQAPFRMRYPGHTLQIDLRYVSDGDVSGKGIYRIITRAAMRTNPDYRKAKLYPGDGYIAGEPAPGDN